MNHSVRFLLIVFYSTCLVIAAIDIGAAKGGSSKIARTGGTNDTGAANRPKSAAQPASPVVREHTGSGLHPNPTPRIRCQAGHGCTEIVGGQRIRVQPVVRDHRTPAPRTGGRGPDY